MSKTSMGSRGGTFCQFTVGAGKPGASARFLRYIANPQAVRDGREGVWFKEFPALLLEVPYPLMTQHLCQWARWLEQKEIIGHQGRGEVRTYYQAILSFEVGVATLQAKSLLASWMQEAFPKAQAAGFVHRNSTHLHIHVWIAARQTDGRKINLSARAFRQLDESWNRIYSRAMGRDEREHLLKKGQTERFKQLRREGREWEKPERVGHRFHPALFNERERQRLGAAEYDRNESRTGSHQSPTSRDDLDSHAREQGIAPHEPAATTEADRMQHALDAAERAVSDTQRLHQDVARVAGCSREQTPEVEPER